VVFTITGEGFAATLQINATAEIDAAGEGGSVDFCYMAVGADGTIYETTTGTATLARMPIQPLDAAGGESCCARTGSCLTDPSDCPF
jgi:hypothetical protein